ncbi:MAG: PDZ domain-containing protein [Ruminococcaceae bacterium]|nr:PDZ domain-containing protein [Oscillospiraceae bacterium]
MRKLRIACVFALIAVTLATHAFAIGAQLRQMSVTSDTTVSEFLDGLDWLSGSSHGAQSKKFSRITDIISQSYYFGITREELYQTITDGCLLRLPHNNIDYIYLLMFRALDKFSYYVPPVLSSPFEDPHYTGYGIVIYDTKRNKYSLTGEGLYIEEVYADSPAAQAGIQPHDKVISVNGIKVENLTLNALTTLLSSYGDTDDCTLTLERDNSLIEFTLHKKSIPSSELMTSFYPQYSTAKFDITAFSSSTLEGLFEQAVKQTYEMGYKNIIIDLRDNPGGVIDYAMNVTDTLITQEHNLFTFETKYDPYFMKYDSDKDGYSFEKIYVMVNENTASASEAMTISLKTLANATVVGTKTYGKQVGQVIHALEDNSSFAVTTIKGYGPNGEDYNTVGIQPDYVIANKPEEFKLPEGYLPLTVQQLPLICDGGDHDAILALEQRFAVMNHLPDEYVDGVYDENLDACIKIFQNLVGEENSQVSEKILTYLDKSIESYPGSISYPNDDQLDFVIDLISGKIPEQSNAVQS